jgi:membrane-bound serine protease (ClpP class)
MKRTIFYALSLLLIFPFASFGESLYQVKKLTYLEVDSSINPATFNYLETNFKKLSAEKGDLAIIKLDTPGGLVSTTKDILTLIGSMDYPVAVWVTPEGASATSAGAIIASGAHILVMSEGTNIGAATPINMGKDIEKSDVKSKAINDLVALVRSLSKARGRSPKYFEKMISNAESLDARDALKKKVIDQIINSDVELVEYLNNRALTVKGKQIRTEVLPTVIVKTIEMDPGQQILNIFANPTTAYVLFVIGAALIYFELQAPGGFVAGGVGVVFLCLAGIGFQVLPLNIGAMGLIILSFILFVLEAYITSFGILTLSGLASLVFGSLFLFRTENSFIELERAVIFSVVAAVSVYVIFLGWFFIKTYKKHKDYYSAETKEGIVLKVLEELNGVFHYQVRVHGEIWNAKSNEKLSLDDNVLVNNADEDELILTITKTKL